jgi:hypothetical protein
MKRGRQQLPPVFLLNLPVAEWWQMRNSAENSQAKPSFKT